MPYTPLELATAFISTGELDDALDALNEHLAASPDDDEARRLRIDTLMRMQDKLRLALADLDALTDATANDLARRSVVCEKLGDLDGAVSAVEAALTLSPHDERLLERCIHLLQAQGKYTEALRRLETVPQSWRWQQWRGDLAAQAGQFDQSTAAYTDALTLLDEHTQGMTLAWAASLRARLLLARAQVYRRREQIDAAEADYLEAGKLIPDDPMIGFQRGLIAAQRGNLDTAAAFCIEAYEAAVAPLKESMRHELESDVRYAELVEKVLK
jgi:tetratricopeptide (TPR) repeat protein